MQSFDCFNVGDTVYSARVHHKRVPVTCPDCNDTRKWAISTSAGASWEITCPRCNGAVYEWQQPHRTELVVEIEEHTVTEVTIRQRASHNADGAVGVFVEYTCNGGIHRNSNNAFATREAAALHGEIMLASHNEKEDEHWARERERVAKHAGRYILEAVADKAAVDRKALEDKLDALKEAFMEAIRYPGLYGPDLRKGTFGAYEITSEAMAKWLNSKFSDAGLDGWSEEEIHEATCEC